MKTIIHDRLQTFSKMLAGGRRTAETEVYGLHIKLRTLTAAEEDEANAMIGVTESVMESSEKRVRGLIAMSIIEIDHKPLEELFKPSEMNNIESSVLTDEKTKQSWIRRELFSWLGDQEPEVLNSIYDEYKKMIVEKRAALRDIKPFS